MVQNRSSCIFKTFLIYKYENDSILENIMSIRVKCKV